MQLIDGAPVYSATDLVGFLACGHRFELERAALAGLVKKPVRSDPTIDLLRERGFEHERRFLADLEAAGRTVVRIDRDGSAVDPADRDPGRELREAAAETVRAMATGADVIYQATFFDGTWRGHADFLLRVDHEPGTPDGLLGAWHYEVVDTKLAAHVAAGAVLQICSYVDQLTRVQGCAPESLYVVLGGSAREQVTLRVADYMAYYRRVKADFVAAADEAHVGPAIYPPALTYPEPVEHCDVCRWWATCRDRRRADDDLSLVAGIGGRQRASLKGRPADVPPGPIATRRGLARLALPVRPRLEGTSDEALSRVREQARIQVEGEDRGEMLWELLEPARAADPTTGEPVLVSDRGFLVLPEPSPGDLFLDLEGDPFAFEDGIDYLFGLLEPARTETEPRWTGAPIGGAAVQETPVPKFHAFWSLDAEGAVTLAAEKTAFERLVDLLVSRLDADPTLHVYHYAAYEKTALARLAQRHATREEEVDRLLRGRVLVDLYRVVRQGLRASVESYSIKRLEPLYGFTRSVELHSAGDSIVEFEVWLGRGAAPDGRAGDEILREIEGYNRDDVLSTWRLRDWLEARRADLAARLGVPVPRPPLRPEAVEPPEPEGRAAEVAAVAEALTRDLEVVEPADRTPAQQASWLLAQLLSWHRRENKAFWWRYFDLCGMTDEDLVEEREPLGMVELDADLGEASRAGARLQRFRFPPQDHRVSVGRQVDDPLTLRSTGHVVAIDQAGGTITLRRTATELARGTAASLIPNEFVRTTTLEDSLLRVGRWVADAGIEADADPHRAGRALLLRAAPGLAGTADGSPLRAHGETAQQAATRLVLALDRSTLAIQGPPGTGKTYAGAQMALALVRAGRTVGITANSHAVIGNMLDAVWKAADDAGVTIALGQKPGPDDGPTCAHAEALGDARDIAARLADGTLDVVGGTAWLWSGPAMEGAVDVLIIDEAGQFSLANAVAVSPAARSLVLLGDPLQLDQPLKGIHPPGAEQSAIGHLLARGGGEPAHLTMPETLGLFIEKTRRLHPAICAYTSEVFYASRLSSLDGLERQSITAPTPPTGSGIRWVPVSHTGNGVESEEEADAIAELLGELLAPAAGATWTDATGVPHALCQGDVWVLAPYNAHVGRIAATLREAGLGAVRVGTVDKVQGREAPLSIYAMGSSSPEDAPRGMEFLYSGNRLNVATSRARCIAVVVASPALVRVACKTPRQMRLTNALCRLVEVAT